MQETLRGGEGKVKECKCQNEFKNGIDSSFNSLVGLIDMLKGLIDMLKLFRVLPK